MEKIYEILKEWKTESKTNGVIQFNYSYRTGNLTIYTSYPGWFIGKAGCYFDKYTNMLKNQMSSFKSIKIIETNYYYVT
jgi:ribosomal protein S3